MSRLFTPTRLFVAVVAATLSTQAMSAGLDRSGQDIKGFFNEGTYAEVDYVYIDTDISGYDQGTETSNGSPDDAFVKGNKTGNITEDSYSFVRYGVKTDINDAVSIGVFYDEPWGAEVRYTGDSNFVSNENQQLATLPGLPLRDITQVETRFGDDDFDPETNVSLHTENWTALVGVKSGGFQVYGGPVLQKAEAELHLRGSAYGPASGYDAIVPNDTEFGWAAGVAYSIPEIALNAALTYRSEIEHEGTVSEYLPIYGIFGQDSDSTSEASLTTPESVNLNFQTGLSQEYQLLGTLDVRWVPWSDFEIVPPYYNELTKIRTQDDVGLPILSYDDDQWKVDVGLAKRFSPTLAGSLQVGWDSGAGNPASSLGPIEGYYSVGGGVKMNMTPEWALSLGGKYLMFGDAKGNLPTGDIVSNFEDNDGYIAGVKLSYQSQ